MNTLRAILMLDQSGAKLTDEFGNASGVSLELLFGSAVRLELDLRSAATGSDGQLASYPASNLAGAEQYYFALNDTFQSTTTPKYLQFENAGVQTVQGRTIFYAEVPALNSETLSSALAGKESSAFFCECGGLNDETPPEVVFCFQFQLTIRNRIYPGAGSAVIAGDPAYYTALETEAVVSGAVVTLSGTVTSMGGRLSAVESDALWTSERIDDADDAIRDLQEWYENVSGNVDKIPSISSAVAPLQPIHAVNVTNLPVSAGQVLEWHLTGNSTMSAVGTAGEYGEAKVEIFTGSNTITFSGINLCDPLIPNAVNFCELHFIGTTVNLHVNNELYGEIVTVTGGTASGSLYYALNNTASEYVTFSGEHHQYTLDGGTVGRSVKMIGNGVDKTSIATPGGTIAVTSGAQVALSNLDIAAVMNAGYATVNLANCHLEGMTGDGMKFSMENCELDGNNGPATIRVGGAGAGNALQDGCRIDNLLVKDVENTNAAVVNCYGGGGHNYENVTLRNCGCTYAITFTLYTTNAVGTIKNIVLENCRSKQILAYVVSPVPVDGLRITGGSARSGISAAGTAQINDLHIESCTLSRGFEGSGTGTFTLVRPYLAATGESLWNANHALVITDGTFATTSDNISNSGAVTFSGTNVMNGTVTNAAGGTVTLASGCVIDARAKTSGFIVSGAAGGLVVESGAAVIPNGGTASVALTGGTYTTLNNNGTLA